MTGIEEAKSPLGFSESSQAVLAMQSLRLPCSIDGVIDFQGLVPYGMIFSQTLKRGDEEAVLVLRSILHS